LVYQTHLLYGIYIDWNSTEYGIIEANFELITQRFMMGTKKERKTSKKSRHHVFHPSPQTQREKELRRRLQEQKRQDKAEKDRLKLEEEAKAQIDDEHLNQSDDDSDASVTETKQSDSNNDNDDDSSDGESQKRNNSDNGDGGDDPSDNGSVEGDTNKKDLDYDPTTGCWLPWKLYTFMGISIDNAKKLSEEISPNSDLTEFKHMTTDLLSTATSTLAKRTDNTKMIVRMYQLNHLISLMYYVKDMFRISCPASIPKSVEKDEFLYMISQAQERAKLRKEQKSAGEALIASDFAVKLKDEKQWERWELELQTTLSNIIGALGISLDYVIRAQKEPIIDGNLSWDKMAVLAAPHSGPEYQVDRRTVHGIIMRNISEDSEAYTYVKPKIKLHDGRKDIENLRKRFNSRSAREQKVNNSDATLKNLVYKSERMLSFSKFVAKFQAAVDNRKECGRTVDEEDLVKSIWDKVQDPTLASFLNALKVQHGINPMPYQTILAKIATEISSKPLLRHNPVLKLSELTSSNMEYVKEGLCPDTGCMTADGKLFIGNYPPAKWNDASVVPYQAEIERLRKTLRSSKNPGKGNGNKNQLSKSSKRNYQRKIKKLKKSQEKLKRKVSQLSSSGGGNDDEQDSGSGDDGDSNAASGKFGGRASRKKT
jgi:hypothetical protein